jgi:hypothetical protein
VAAIVARSVGVCSNAPPLLSQHPQSFSAAAHSRLAVMMRGEAVLVMRGESAMLHCGYEVSCDAERCAMRYGPYSPDCDGPSCVATRARCRRREVEKE